MFDLHYDRRARLLRYSMSGFWTMTTVQDFATALRDLAASMGPPPVRFDALCGARNFPVQTREVSEALGQIMAVGRAMREGRTAIVVGSMMNKLQAERALGKDDLRTFMSMEEAEAWLAEPRD